MEGQGRNDNLKNVCSGKWRQSRIVPTVLLHKILLKLKFKIIVKKSRQMSDRKVLVKRSGTASSHCRPRIGPRQTSLSFPTLCVERHCTIPPVSRSSSSSPASTVRCLVFYRWPRINRDYVSRWRELYSQWEVSDGVSQRGPLRLQYHQ